MFGDTFYKLEKDRVIPEIKINFVKYAIENDVNNFSTNDQLAYFKNNNDIAYFPVLNINNDLLFCFTYLMKSENDQNLNHYINLKETGKTWHVSKIVKDITEFPSEINLSINHAFGNEGMYQDILIDIIIPSEYLQPDKKKVNTTELGELSRNDNPIILLMKIKG